MKELKKLSLKAEIDKDAEKTEKEVRNNKDLEDVKVSPDMENALFQRIMDYEYDKRGKKVYRRKKKRLVLVALAAVLVLAFGSVMTGVGSKSYWRVLWDRIIGDEKASVINTESMNSQKTERLNEIDVYKKINQTFGITPVRMIEKPENMYLENITIDEEQRYVALFYNYNNEMIRYSMYLNDSDSSFGQKETDKLVDSYDMMVNNIVINVKEYSIGNKNRYDAEFEYEDVNYQLKGVMNKNEFEQIVKNLQFL